MGHIPHTELLALGNAFEEDFRAQFWSTGGGQKDVKAFYQRRVVRSRGTERSQMLDAHGKPTIDPNESESLQTIRPIVIRGFGYVDLMISYVDDDGMDCYVVIEVKNTDWNKIAAKQTVRRLGAHRRQVYGYLEPLEYRARLRQIGAPQGILVYPKRPEPEADAFVSEYLTFGYSIQVAYKEELLEQYVADRESFPDQTKESQSYDHWLSESPACSKCSSGQVAIRQKPTPHSLANDIAKVHAIGCGASVPSDRTI
jgi:hypothetical protein